MFLFIVGIVAIMSGMCVSVALRVARTKHNR